MRSPIGEPVWDRLDRVAHIRPPRPPAAGTNATAWRSVPTSRRRSASCTAAAASPRRPKRRSRRPAGRCSGSRRSSSGRHRLVRSSTWRWWSPDGRATTQSQVIATVDGEPMFTSLCAHTLRPGGDGAQFIEMPEVPAPDDCDGDGATVRRRSLQLVLRDAGPPGRGRTIGPGGHRQSAARLMAIWCRVAATRSAPRRRRPSSPTSSRSPSGRARCAAGCDEPRQHAAGDRPRADRLGVARTRRRGFHRSIGHGSLRIWGEDGRLKGIAQQSAIIRTSHHDRSDDLTRFGPAPGRDQPSGSRSPVRRRCRPGRRSAVGRRANATARRDGAERTGRRCRSACRLDLGEGPPADLVEVARRGADPS